MSSDYDSDELQALFDDISLRSAVPRPPGSESPRHDDGSADHGLYNGIGSLARRLHDALREAAGPDGALARADSVLPESRERLAFIGGLMEKSATQCVLLTEREMPRLDASSAALKAAKARWEAVVAGQSTVAEFTALAIHTPAALQSAIDDQAHVKSSLMEILLAQGFQDLAGQTLSKVTLQVLGLERELLGLLSLAASGRPQKGAIADFLDGPQYKPTEEASHSQSAVDDLLNELGF